MYRIRKNLHSNNAHSDFCAELILLSEFVIHHTVLRGSGK
jgi:hypothetical protein